MTPRSGPVYLVAGVAVAADREVPGLPAASGPAAVRVAFGAEGAVPPAEHGWHRLADGRTPEAWLRADGTGAWIAGLGEDGALLQLRRVLPFACALQGAVMLHAAAADRGDGLLLFVGESGAGKSTLAAGLARRGFAALADDLVLCRPTPEGVRVPAPPAGPGTRAPLAPAALCFLARRAGLPTPAAIPLPRAEALRRLLRHGFGEVALPRAWAAQFDCYQALAAETPAFDLLLPDDRERLGETYDALAAEILPALLATRGRAP